MLPAETLVVRLTSCGPVLQPQAVPDDAKDQKYWTRRERNNFAAKRSREARRLKENQIVLRANFLEKEVSGGFRRMAFRWVQ